MHIVDFLIFALAIAAGAAAFAAIHREANDASGSRIAWAVVGGVAAMFTALQVATLWLLQTGDPWNNARLTPAIALHYGFKLYYPLHEGPILSTVVGPVAFLAYWPVGFLRGSPTALILAGSALNLAAFAWLLVALVRRLAQGVTLRLFAALIGVQLALYYPSLRYSLFCIHADAPALFFSGLGAGFVIFARDELRWSRCLGAALALTLAVWAKQSLAPIFLIVAMLAAVHHGPRSGIRFVVASVLVGAMISATFAGWLGFANLRDNMFVVPARHPWHQMSLVTGEIFGQLNAVGRAAHLKVLAASMLQIIRESWALFAVLLLALGENLRQGRFTGRWPRRAWAACLFIAVGLLPTAAIGRTKVGGEVNHESLVVFFLAAAIVCWLASIGFERGRPVPARLATVLAVLALINAPRVLDYPGWRGAWENQNETAYTYDTRHPGEVYFPWNPLTSLLAEGKLYHFDYGVFDRNLGEARVSAEHIAQHLPSSRPKIASFLAHHDYILHTYFPDYRALPDDPGLPGWRLYGPP